MGSNFNVILGTQSVGEPVLEMIKKLYVVRAGKVKRSKPPPSWAGNGNASARPGKVRLQEGTTGHKNVMKEGL